MSSVTAPRSHTLRREEGSQRTQEAPPRLADAERSLYRFAGWAMLAAALLTVGSITAYVVWPPPQGGAAEWFRLYDDNPLLGMVSLDLPFVLVSFLMLPAMLALYTALRRTSPAAALLATALYGVTFAAALAANPMVEMLTLSREYLTADAAQQTALLGAGEAMLAAYEGTAFHLFYIGGQIAGIVLGVAMLRGSRLFPKPIAVTMIAGNLVGFGLYLPVVGLALSVFSGVVLLAWMVLLGRRFLQLGGPGWE